jgi:hypothetical protein
MISDGRAGLTASTIFVIARAREKSAPNTTTVRM